MMKDQTRRRHKVSVGGTVAAVHASAVCISIAVGEEAQVEKISRSIGGSGIS